MQEPGTDAGAKQRREAMIGIVLAGGRASRLGGGDKGFRLIEGVSILDRIVAAMRQQCAMVVINANGDPTPFSRFGLPVVADTVSHHPGPLAGVLAGLEWAAVRAPACPAVATVPTDTPFLPRDLVGRLEDARRADRAAVACARSNGRVHFTTAVWSVELLPELCAALRDAGIRRMSEFTSRQVVAYVDWPVVPFDPFLNVNTPEDLNVAARVARELPGRR